MKVKLFALWIGPLPEWYEQWRQRCNEAMCNYGEVELIHWPRLQQGNKEVSEFAGTPCRKSSPYNLGCEVRPLLGEMYRDRLQGFSHWGWIDLDVVLGDLGMIEEELTIHDVVSAETGGTAGSMTILRNEDGILGNVTNTAWRHCDYKTMLANPAYCNFDEIGFDLSGYNPSLTKILRDTTFAFGSASLHCDWRTWCDAWEPGEGGKPSRTCEIREGGRLWEVPTGRELLLYHFHRGKRWPVGDSPAVKMPPDHLRPDFWASRLKDAITSGDLWKSSMDVPCSEWAACQDHSRRVLSEYIQPGQRLLDVGCGIGFLKRVMPAGVDYVGIDFCKELIQFMFGFMPSTAVSMDARNIKFDADSFDWAVCRGLEGSMKTWSMAEWAKVESEMLRVARRVLLIDSSLGHRIVERST